MGIQTRFLMLHIFKIPASIVKYLAADKLAWLASSTIPSLATDTQQKDS